MSETVFILGAGASHEAGAPLMMNFLDVAAELIRTKRVSDQFLGAFTDVLRARAALDAVHAKAAIDTDNLEDVFAAFEMAALFRRPFGDLDEPFVARLPNAMRKVIVEVLERTIKFAVVKVPGTEGREKRYVAAPGAYEHFGGLINSLRRDGQSVSVVTFNYDIAVDFALYKNELAIDYCLSDLEAHQGDPRRIDLMKLHGSVNWIRCEQCGIAPYTLPEYFKRWPVSNLFDVREVPIAFTNRFVELNHCNAPRGNPEDIAIVPPTWNKGAHHHEKIACVWRRAARHLSEARRIVVIGYSFPETDNFFKYLYALGTVGPTRIERFWLIDPDKSGNVRARFERLLGPAVRDRRVEIGKDTFEQMRGPLTEYFKVRRA